MVKSICGHIGGVLGKGRGLPPGLGILICKRYPLPLAKIDLTPLSSPLPLRSDPVPTYGQKFKKYRLLGREAIGPFETPSSALIMPSDPPSRNV
jgi:hypothetical protein